MKQWISVLLALSLLTLTGCAKKEEGSVPSAPVRVETESVPVESERPPTEIPADAVTIRLSDDGVSTDSKAVHTANDIIYYEAGKDFTYGEGSEADAHTPEEAAAHTVVHITQPGTYVLEGKLSKGQVAVDLGKEAKEDPSAVVTLVLNGVDITCEVAPAVIFYNVYECGSDDAETATKDVDTSAAGANVYIMENTENYVNGSYVARIYKPDSVVLNGDGTEVEDAKKLHKYDAAFYSKMSMNMDGGKNGLLAIKAENEGLDSELHLTINGGEISIHSGNDGINTNEDGVSVTTVNGGFLSICVTGETGEGDGIDSNGWLVINGGTVIAAGHMLDPIEDGGQKYVVFHLPQSQSGEDTVTVKNEAGEEVTGHLPVNDYSVLIYSSPELTEGEYTLWSGDTQLAVGSSGGMMEGFGGFAGGMRPGGMVPGGEKWPEMEGFDPSQLPWIPMDGEKGPPEGFELPEGFEPPKGFKPPEGSRGLRGMGGGFRPNGFDGSPSGEQ